MNCLITGGLGFVGRRLSNFFLNEGAKVTAIGLRKQPRGIEHPEFHYIPGDTTQEGAWQEELEKQDVVVNLTGRSIFARWTERKKKEIYESRILTTRNLVNALPTHSGITFCSTSAVGYYGSRGEEILTEEEPPGEDFLARLGRDWEEEALRAEKRGHRVVLTRFGIVLDNEGGAMAKMIPAFRSFVGGPLGDGMQWFSWIHMHDLLSAYRFVIENPQIRGPVNFCSPQPVRNKELAEKLGDALARPAFMPAPGFLIKLALGEFGESILSSQRAVPQRLSEYGFNFRYPDIGSALSEIVGRTA